MRSVRLLAAGFGLAVLALSCVPPKRFAIKTPPPTRPLPSAPDVLRQAQELIAGASMLYVSDYFSFVGTDGRGILFADLQGSTGLQERMDPESVRALMGRYYAAMRATVEAHGGKVVKFVGDGAMAVFGVPEVAEDDALRAVRAAVDM